MRLAVFFVIALPLAGCGVKLVDPCAEINGTCLGIQVDPSSTVKELDYLQLQINGTNVGRPIVSGAVLKLPVAVGLNLNDQVQSMQQLRIELVGTTAGQSCRGDRQVSISKGQHETVDIVLDRVGGGEDGGEATPDLQSLDLAPDCTIVYVAPTGDDHSNGCSQSTPKRTIGAAILATTTQTKEIHVCAGRYAETGLAAAGKILGGYDCQTWQRKDTYGYPTFDKTNETTIENVDNGSALSVTDSSATIDGFTISERAIAGATFSAAVYSNGGTATLSNSKIIGAAPSAGNHQTLGVRIGGMASVDLHSCLVNGGSGFAPTSSDYGSEAIRIEAGASGHVHIHDNIINGGSGSGGYAASVGIYIGDATLTAANGTAIENNLINGGVGVSPDADYNHWSAIGVHAASASTVELINNQIDAGIIDGGHTVGVYANNSGQLRVLRNRIFGGRLSHAKGPGVIAVGVNLTNSGPVELANNLIHGGDGSTLDTFAFYGGVTGDVVIHHNTVVAGLTSGSSSVFANVQTIPSLNKKMTVENNIMLGFGNNARVILTFECPSNGWLTSFSNNLTFGAKILEYWSNIAGPCVGGQTFTSDDAVQAELVNRCGNSGSCKFGGNVNLQTSCAADGGCLAFSGCSNAGGCAAALFDSWDVSTNGISNLFGAGWNLKANDPCAVTRSSLDLTAQVGVDVFGNPRTPPPSMGAHQFNDPKLCK
jgi:hypothetical protein